MRKFLLALLIFLLWALFAMWFHITQSNKICGNCATQHNTTCSSSKENENKATENVKLENAAYAFSISDINGKSIFKFPKGFIINAKNGNVTIPASINGFKDSIFNYLNKHQDKELLLKANYLSSEITDGSNLGVSRAEFLKNILVKFGINKDRIVTKAVLADYSYDENGTNSNAFSLLFKNISETHLKEIEEGIANKTLYSNFGQATFKADRTLQEYAYGLKNFLAKYPTKTVHIIGHTDNVGATNANYQLGLKRANQVKDYLVSQGIETKFIKASSKGETNPVATNNTDQGRTLNRRIQITVN